MKPKHAPSEEMITAYHEAGHAVAGCLVRQRFGKITIVPDADLLGQCTFVLLKNVHPDTDDDERTLTYVKKTMYIGLAAVACERKLSRDRRPPDWNHELHPKACFTYATMTIGPLDTALAFANFIWLQAKDSMNFHWRAVQRLAEALLREKTIPYHRARKLVSGPDGSMPVSRVI